MSYVPAFPPMTATGFEPQRRNMLPVLGTGQWTDAAQQANWALGHGSTLVTSGPSQYDMTSGGSPYEFRFKCMPRPQNTYRLWTVSLAADDDGGGCTLRSLDGATDYARADIPPSDADVKAHAGLIVSFPQSNADDSVDGSGHSEFGFEIVVDAGVDAVWVTSIGCYELPLVFAAPGDVPSPGVFPEESAMASGEPIYDDGNVPAEKSAAAVAYAAVAAETSARRSAMAAWALYETAFITTSTFVDAYGGYVPLLARRRYSSDTAGNRSIRVWVQAAGVGQVRLTMTNGSTTTLTYASAGVYQWQTATISVDAENLANLGTDGGLQSSTRDELRVEIRCTDAIVLAVRCVCAGEID